MSRSTRPVVRTMGYVLLTMSAISAATAAAAHCSTRQHFDWVIKNALIYDGSGAPAVHGSLAIRGERVVQLGEVGELTGAQEIDAQGLALAPGFINMLSWANESLLQDGRSVSDLTQGVTLEVLGEGDSMGPLTPAMRQEMRQKQGDIRYDITWSSLGASFVGASTVRIHELGEGDQTPSAKQLQHMQALVRQAMREGALGLSSALIYAPGVYAQPAELQALALTAARAGGGYISHLRGESTRLVESLDELIDVARRTGAHAEVYHLKAAGVANWPGMATAIAHIEAARHAGYDVGANMYSYEAAASGLDATMPPWVKADGLDAWLARLKDPGVRQRVLQDMRSPHAYWDRYLAQVGSPDRVLLVKFKNATLKPLAGLTLAQVASLRHESPEETSMDLVIEDHSRVGAIYFLMSEDNVRLGLTQPWMSLGSDEASQAPEGLFLLSRPHPRAYGNVARFLGRYVREQQLVSLPEAIRRLTQLPARNWKLRDRGCLQAGCYADLVIFDPNTIIDRATYADPQRLAEGVRDVFVNGQQVIRNGTPTGARPGQVVRGPGWIGWTGATTAAAPTHARSSGTSCSNP